MTKKILPPEANSEIFIALTSRLGTDVSTVVTSIETAFSRYRYSCIHIRVSDLIKDAYPLEEIPSAPDGRITKLMNLGTSYRSSNKRADALAKLTVLSIMKHRKDLTGDVSETSDRHVYIIDQLKRPEEVKLLKEVYGQQLFTISCHAPYEHRLKKLQELFLLNHAEKADIEHWRDAAKDLIERDDNESHAPYGQRVQDTFPLADFFIDTSDAVDESSRRVVDLIFGDPTLSPTMDEFGSYLAASAALRSNDLSRQVGAAILSEDGEVLALGCNEVPVAHGGIYWPDVHKTDSRDVALGADINTILKKDMIVDIFVKMREAGWLKKPAADYSLEEVIQNEIDNKKSGALANAKLLSSLEFGRAMHAEMTAISSAAKSGVAIKGATLYCTTFPCHNCAKHIVGSGIKRVVFREPYEKSRALQLYPDAIRLDCRDEQYVSFDQFIGVGFSRFQELFYKSNKPSKDKSGKVVPLKPKEAQPISAQPFPQYLRLEAALGNLDDEGR